LGRRERKEVTLMATKKPEKKATKKPAKKK
jgi:hypothetical protein